ncbi:hypothetical protein [Actinoplanes awajinensis]|uniref:hypothetical protein n=1 Tax=Actinoplanes awajinensis TaxID=135946 RepID=UPI000AF67FBB|nr:hypothetical protein [Actinoplanes awajinensis]
MAGLAIDLRHPAGAFLYNVTKPKLVIDGIDHQVPDWGQYLFDVPPGPHRVEVWVPYVFPRRAGRASVDLVIAEQGVSMEYMAPSVTFAKGSLGPAGQQKSAGFKTVHAFNIAAIVLVVIAFIYLRTR